MKIGTCDCCDARNVELSFGQIAGLETWACTDGCQRPQQWKDCPACEGSGIIAHRVTVYEHGCGFPHDDTDERPCGLCGGDGRVAEEEDD